MEKTPIQNWFIELKRIWLEKDIQMLGRLVSDSFEYYEDPFQKPLTNLTDLTKVWGEVNVQNIQKLDIDILIDNGQLGMARYEFLYKDEQDISHQSSGVYYVEVDSKGRALVFRQWWMEKK